MPRLYLYDGSDVPTLWLKYLDCVIDVNAVIQKSSFRQNFSLGTKRYRKDNGTIGTSSIQEVFHEKKQVGRREYGGVGKKEYTVTYIPFKS
jgi:hypothetical protein